MLSPGSRPVWLGAASGCSPVDARGTGPGGLGHGHRMLVCAAEAGRARAVLTADGKLTVGSATADMGTGTYTIMAQIAAQALGLSLEQVTFELGDSDLPLAPNSGGSETAASIGLAVQRVCDKLKDTLLQFSRSLETLPLPWRIRTK
jgi:xanthine dehydrogenase YagR molybdenum-binding subunit